jgi:hypothetical protein
MVRRMAKTDGKESKGELVVRMAGRLSRPGGNQQGVSRERCNDKR